MTIRHWNSRCNIWQLHAAYSTQCIMIQRSLPASSIELHTNARQQITLFCFPADSPDESNPDTSLLTYKAMQQQIDEELTSCETLDALFTQSPWSNTTPWNEELNTPHHQEPFLPLIPSPEPEIQQKPATPPTSPVRRAQFTAKALYTIESIINFYLHHSSTSITRVNLTHEYHNEWNKLNTEYRKPFYHLASVNPNNIWEIGMHLLRHNTAKPDGELISIKAEMGDEALVAERRYFTISYGETPRQSSTDAVIEYITAYVPKKVLLLDRRGR